MCAGIVDEQAAGGFSDEGDFREVEVVLGCVGLYPADGVVDVFHGLREVGLGREAVVDAEPGEASVRERGEERADVGAFATGIEAAAVHEDGDGEGAGAVGNVKVKQQGLAAGSGIFDVPSITCGTTWSTALRAGGDGCIGKGEDENE